MAKQIRDDEDNLKRRARRRLIGAVALVTVVVVLLPMVLDSEPKPTGNDIELRIPDKDKVGDFVSKIDAPTAPAAVLAASSAAAVSAVASAPLVESQVAAAPASVVPVVVESKPLPVPETKSAEHAEPKPHASPEGFIVQIGAFSNVDTAHRWHKNLVNQGIKAYTEKAGDKVRVRVGPFVTHEAAEKLRHRLESQGLKPAIIPAQ